MVNAVLAIITAPIDRRHGWGYTTKKSGIFRRYKPPLFYENTRYIQ